MTPRARCWPRQSTAILIIHGIGEQAPLETLEAFTAPFWNTLERLNGETLLPADHRVSWQKGWTENYLSLGRTAGERVRVDFHEYYWAHLAERQATFADIVQWLITTSDGAQKFYKDNEWMVERYENTGVTAFRGRQFKSRWYLRHLGWLMRVLSIFPSAVAVWFARWLGPLLVFLNPLFRWIETVIVNFIGDIVIYTASDARSKFYDARVRILDGAVDALCGLLENKRYGKVILVGHSLGSVIAFDALNRMNHMMNLGIVDDRLARKIQGLVTFGSPLDKIAFFFRERTRDDEYIRRQILQHFHSFKARPLAEQPNPKQISDPFRPLLEHVRWINFWDPADPISGCLDFYRVDENIMFSMGKESFKAHNAYWEWKEMYERIILEAGWG